MKTIAEEERLDLDKRVIEFAGQMLDEAEKAAKDRSFSYAAAYLSLAQRAKAIGMKGQDPIMLAEAQNLIDE